MKPIRAFICWLLVATQAFAGITYSGTTGQTLYARVQTGASTFVACALTEGSSGGLGIYSVTDAALVTAGLSSPSTGNGFEYTVRSGSASTTANDAIKGYGTIAWSGSVELARPANVTQFGGMAGTSIGGLPLVASAGSGRTWYVNASTGSDSNSGVTDAAPFATYGAANTAAKFGDTVFIDGDYTTTITMDKPLHIKGRGRGKSRIVSSGTNDVVISVPNTSDAAVNGFMISDIAIFGIGSNATGIGGDDLNNLRMERVSVTAPTGIDLGGDARGQMFFNGLRVEATGTVGIKSRSNCSVRLQDSYVYLSTSTDANVAAITLSGSLAVLDNVRALCVQTGASSHVTAGITNRHGTGTVGSETSLGLTKLYNCDVRAVASSASNTGEVRGLTYSYSSGDDTQPFYVTADSLNVETSNSGSGGRVDIKGNPTDVGSFLTGQRMHYATTGGNVTIKATDDTVAANLDAAVSTRSQAGDVMKVSSGTGANQINLSGGHVTNVDTLTTYTGNTPQTGDSYARLGAPAGASHAADVAAINTKLGTPAHTDIAGDIANVSGGGGDGFSDTERAQILAALSVGEDIGVPKNLTWVIARKDGDMKATAPIPKDSGEGVDVAADFRGVLGASDAIAPSGGIVSITLVTTGSGLIASPAFSDVSQATLWMNSAVRFHITGGTAGTTYTVRVKVLTVGGQTYSALCQMKVTGS